MNNPLLQKIETDRLILSSLDHHYASDHLQYYQRNRDFFKPFLPSYSASTFTLAHQVQKLSGEQERREKGQEIKFYIFEKTEVASNRIIGDLCFSNIVRGPLQACYLGYKLDKNVQGNGYMTEALKAAIPLVFNVFNLHRIEAHIMPKNQSSISVIERLGFQFEGRCSAYLKINGQWEDHLRYALINEDFVE